MTRFGFGLIGLARWDAGLRLALAAVIGCCLASRSDAVVTHNYLFNSGDGTQILDSVGTAHGMVMDASGQNLTSVSVAESRLVLGGPDETGVEFGGWGELPGPDIAINTYSELSLELWASVSPLNTNDWTFAVGLGNTSDGSGTVPANQGEAYLMMQLTRAPGGEGNRGAITPTNFADEVGVTDGARDLSDGTLHHTVLTVDDTVLGWYVDGIQIGTAELGDVSIADVSNNLAYLGRSLYNPDEAMIGSIFEFRIFDNALTPEEIETRFLDGCLDTCGDGAAVEINRSTGGVRFTNDLSAQNIVRYTFESPAGGFDPSQWDSITDTGLDPDDVWQILDSGPTILSEEDPIGGGGPDDGIVLETSIPLGTPWIRSPFEDVTATVTVLDPITFDEQDVEFPVIYTGGDPLSRSDFDLDGDVDEFDYAALNDNHLTPLVGETALDTHPFGDTDGDGDNDFFDWRNFRDDFIDLNGMAAFEALGANIAPEPASGVLALAMLACLGACRRRTAGG